MFIWSWFENRGWPDEWARLTVASWLSWIWSLHCNCLLLHPNQVPCKINSPIPTIDHIINKPTLNMKCKYKKSTLILFNGRKSWLYPFQEEKTVDHYYKRSSRYQCRIFRKANLLLLQRAVSCMNMSHMYVGMSQKHLNPFSNALPLGILI